MATLSSGRYLLGVAELLLLVGLAWLGAARLRRRLLPAFEGTPAWLATAVLALALLIWAAEALGTFGAWAPGPYLALMAVLGLGAWALLGQPAGDVSPFAGRRGGRVRPQDTPAGAPFVPTLIALALAGVALVHFAVGAKARLRIFEKV